jgi:multifunctional methyltransferase subunit TRM112
LPTTESASVIDTDNVASAAWNEVDTETPAVTDMDEYQNELKTIFCALFEIHVMEGVLICPDTQREFPIKDGIPNMILHEDEL